MNTSKRGRLLAISKKIERVLSPATSPATAGHGLWMWRVWSIIVMGTQVAYFTVGAVGLTTLTLCTKICFWSGAPRGQGGPGHVPHRSHG